MGPGTKSSVLGALNSGYDDDTVPYIVGGVAAGVVFVVLCWYVFMKVKIHKAIKDSLK